MIKTTIDFLDFILMEYWPALCSVSLSFAVFHVCKNGFRINLAKRKEEK